MTIALCINCGEMKLGALGQCKNCMADIENQELSILFSDWSHSYEKLVHFGKVIKEIQLHNSESQVCFRAFIFYASAQDPKRIKISLSPEELRETEELLSNCMFPPFEEKQENN